MKKQFILFLGIGNLLFSCSSSSNEIDVKKEPTKAVENPTNSVAITEKTKESSGAFSGTIVTDPNEMKSIHSPISSFVQSILVKEGQKVSKGQVLAYMEHRSIIIIQKDYLQAKALYRQFVEEFERKKTLFDQKVIFQKELTESEVKFIAQKAEFQAKKEELAILGISVKDLESGNFSNRISIRATSNGIINHVWVHAGEFVQEEKPLFELVNTGAWYLQAELYSNDANRVRIGDSLTFQTGNDTFYTQIERINPSVDPTKQVLTIYSKKIEQSNSIYLGERVFVSLIQP